VGLRITVACEDHTLDQYVACPVIKLLMAHLGRPRADVRVITSPRLRGINDLISQICPILERYGAISRLVIFVVDGDCDDGRDGKLDRLTKFRKLVDDCDNGEKGVVVVARQELEVWALWGSRIQTSARWADILEECHPKERFFEPLVTSADRKVPGRGRQRLTALSVDQGWDSLSAGCSELRDLEAELRMKLDL
jgi:hypothetical protein